MTDSKALIERLRYTEEHGIFTAHDAGLAAMPGEAADAIERLEADNARLREALGAYTEYCNICHSRGSIIEEDEVTCADLWRDCPGCTPARAALQETSHD